MQLEVTEHHLRVYMVHLKGRIDAVTAPAIKEALKKMTRDERCNFIIDLREASFIDSTGLSVFTSLARAARSCKGDVRFVVTRHSMVDKILAVVSFDRVFEFYETPDEALEHFRF